MSTVKTVKIVVLVVSVALSAAHFAVDMALRLRTSVLMSLSVRK